MTFNCNKSPQRGDERVITRFAFWPVKICNTTKWLERIKLKQVYVCDGAADCIYEGWDNIEFLEKSQEGV